MVAVVKPVIQVRAMRAKDLSTVSAMEVASYEFPWSHGIFNDCLKAGHPCWVLCVDAMVAGYGILSMGAGEAHLLNICIAPDYRGKGLGRHLLGRLLDIARWNGAERLFLEVRPSNPLAKTLYESAGFSEIGRRPRYYPARDGREDAIVMALDMAEGHIEK
ncbi:ribosomal-protein-alanine N-acetyltransferase [Rhodanobacter sp. B04]|uniref:ribosomal protein S18-alanine N-acetyltransferase n=1 Tax=Rhodanobacter sp. B04 TaxID=1945860 RepID=UPI0009844C73|nr:ribosomal protein S18-alanine N-acetyltransferase [Rhodanobacter sp. B04]OOG66127.1 ribosomal-protein-alanine N-acetyltransferase [Rhodanobacter sp. B04]